MLGIYTEYWQMLPKLARSSADGVIYSVYSFTHSFTFTPIHLVCADDKFFCEIQQKPSSMSNLVFLMQREVQWHVFLPNIAQWFFFL